MDKKSARIKSITGICLIGIIMAGFLCVSVSMLAKNVLFDLFHIDNDAVVFLTRNMEELTAAEEEVQPEKAQEQSEMTQIQPEAAQEHPELTQTQPEIEQDQPEAVQEIEEEHPQESGFLQQVKAKLDKYEEKVGFLEERITWYSQDWFLLRHEMLYGAAVYDRAIDWWLPDFSDDNDIIRMDNGHLTYVLQRKDEAVIEDFGAGVAGLSQAVQNAGGSFLYVNVPSKTCRYGRQLPEGVPEYSIENGEVLLSYLRGHNVNVIDFRDKLHEAGMDHYDAFFKGDLHWRPETGFWAAGVLAQELNDSYGFDFGEKCFELDNYQATAYDSSYEGGITYKITRAKSPYDDYTLILPDFQTHLTVDIPAKNFYETGEFRDVLANLTFLENDVWTDPSKCYHSWQWINNPLGNVVNLQPEHNLGKRLLVITDSFGWPVVPYLALDIEYTDIIYPGSFQGSIIEYVQETKPDMVVYLLAERDIGIRSEY